VVLAAPVPPRPAPPSAPAPGPLSPPPSSVGPVHAAVRSAVPPSFTLRVLQMNLCNSGQAPDCYTGGRSVAEAAAKIAEFEPDVVTLNEVCQRDVLGPLFRAMAAGHASDAVVAAFEPAWNRPHRAPYRCTDGDSYGDGLIARVPAAGYRHGFVSGGTYPEAMQDQSDDEERGWVCVDMSARYYACTSHLVAHHPDLAARQCDELMGADVPGFVGAHGSAAPVIVGSDFNLVDNGGAAYDVNACAPDGFYVEDDPAQPGVEPQHFMVSRALALRDLVDLDMQRTTDHPGLLITVQAGGGSP